MPLYRLHRHDELIAPVVVAALDGWVDAGSVATTAAELVAEGGTKVATFDPDELFDFRSRRPTLEIHDGRLAKLTWPELTMTHRRYGDQDLLILTGAEPDGRWHQFSDEIVELVGRFGVSAWISIGAIPAAVPHTRPVPIMGTESSPGLLRGNVAAGPVGTLRVPGAALSVLEMAVAAAGVPAVGYFAQIPHYVSGSYAPASVELIRALGRHLGLELPVGNLETESLLLRARLDAAATADDSTGSYVRRLEAMVDESRRPEGEDLIGEIERFLRDRDSDVGGGSRPN